MQRKRETGMGVLMRETYRRVLGRRDVLSALVPYVLARLPLSMASLALLLLVRAETGSYHLAGIACAGYALAVAAAAPALGRLVDRRGQSPVLLICGVVHPTAMVGVALAAHAHVYPLVLVCAVAAGGSLPPMAACMRVLWGELLSDDVSRRAGFAIEGVIVEIAELTGPILVSVALLLSSPAAAVVAAGLLTGVAALAFRSSQASRSVPLSVGGVHRWGALSLPGVRRLLLIITASTATIGGVEVAVTAYARVHGGLASAGFYVALISLGGIGAGLFFGGTSRMADRRGPAALGRFMLLSGLSVVALSGLTYSHFELAALVLFGATIAIGVVVQLTMMSAIASESVRTEAFTWGGTANFVGLGLGTAVVGWVVDGHGLSTGFMVAAIPAGCAAVIAFCSWRELSVDAQTGLAEAGVAEAGAGEDVAVEPVAVEIATTDTGTFEVWTTDGTPAATALVDVPRQETPWHALRPMAGDVLPGAPFLAAVPSDNPEPDEVERLHTQVAELEAALAAALLASSGTGASDDARSRSQRMLERADTACLELRTRAEDDAARVRAAATQASLEILASAQRDARAILERARRDAETISSRGGQDLPAPEGRSHAPEATEPGALARAPQEPARIAEERPLLHAIPDFDGPDEVVHLL